MQSDLLQPDCRYCCQRLPVHTHLFLSDFFLAGTLLGVGSLQRLTVKSDLAKAQPPVQTHLFWSDFHRA